MGMLQENENDWMKMHGSWSSKI